MGYFTKEQKDLLSNAKGIIRAVNHPLREKILVFIKESNNRTAVTPIFKRLRIEQSVASQHLGILRRAGIVTASHEGQEKYYSVSDAAIKFLLEKCETLVTPEEKG